jgi:hypothetical protein
MIVAEGVHANDLRDGDSGEAADGSSESEQTFGAPPRHIDQTTAELDRYARTWIDLQQTRKALAQRELPDEIVAEFDRLEKKVSALLTRTLRKHALWPWLRQYPGLGGAHTALIIGRIGDPRRFPGQRCTEGHYLPPLYAEGAPCPIAASTRGIDPAFGDGADSDERPLAEVRSEIEVMTGDGQISGADVRGAEIESLSVCPGTMLPPRTITGVRPLWHWAGLHADDEGNSPRKRKGVRCTWEPRVRASVMQPGGIAEQIVRLNVPVYANRYRTAKANLNLRVADIGGVIEFHSGNATNGRVADDPSEINAPSGRPLRPYQADRTARKIAAKAFLGDLLTEWKRLNQKIHA